ncbi:AAA family ATPase [Lelliottia amnigena]|uniref:AAA family ATPase n=1 Tax=Lelliottia amnigena TaxID=61646 RepID=UPI001C234182|nr:AAA family ATPase [Lelliottia amnigena]QXB23312.1 AAA family ATPase [Lelliottia amnigena]
MIKLTEVTIHKYKSIESDQQFKVEDDVTVLVGMNESGKTSVLEAIGKSNYFIKDDKFLYNLTHDYPRKEKKAIDKTGEDPIAITSTFKIDESFINDVNVGVLENVLGSDTFTIDKAYSGKSKISMPKVHKDIFFKNIKSIYVNIPSEFVSKLQAVKDVETFNKIAAEIAAEEYHSDVVSLGKYFNNSRKWDNPLEEYFYGEVLHPNIPKFLYYDEYYTLPSRISIEGLKDAKLEADELKTARALFELAEINIDELLNATEFEDYKAELEATEAIISEELFEFWTTNKNLDIAFDIDKKTKTVNNNTTIVEHILDIRVRNNRTRVSLPLKNRSKGFNWFFSFLVWFKKIQEDRSSNYIILLDEPGLNLHASAQKDLLRFIESLSRSYQVIYTTHSPFMVESKNLHKVRTVFETDKGSIISDSIQQKDPNTLFPLQAALGYDIAQNLYISEKNLLVEGTSDLIYLQVISALLQEKKKTGLRDDITIVPVGGLEKVATFISLLRGSKLNVVCLLDSLTDQSSKTKIERLISDKILKKQNVMYFDSFIDNKSVADIEDLFAEGDYIKLFNEAFKDEYFVDKGEMDSSIERIVVRIARKINKERFNHYRPANHFAKTYHDLKNLSEETIKNFEAVITAINKSF